MTQLKIKINIVLLLILFSSTQLFSLPDIVEKSEKLFLDGDRPAAVAILKNWIVNNKNSSEFQDVFLHYLSYLEDGDSILIEIERFIINNDSPQLILLAAETAELMGEYFIASEYYLRASQISSDLEQLNDSLIEYSELKLYLGDYKKAEEQIRLILPECQNNNQKSSALIVLSRALHMRGIGTKSFKAALEAVETDISPESLYLVQFLSEEYDFDIPIEMQTMLEKSISLSHQASFENTLITRKINPLSLHLNWDESMSIIDQPLVSELTEDPIITGNIQVGSFSDPENALELSNVLLNNGYTTETVVSTKDNKTYHRVIIIDIDVNLLESELTDLRQKGFDGFIIR